MVAQHLSALGFKAKGGFDLDADDVHFVRGGSHKVLNDTIECWHVRCVDPTGKLVEIFSANTLTECYGGIEVKPNTPETCLYGDLVAAPKRGGAVCA